MQLKWCRSDAVLVCVLLLVAPSAADSTATTLPTSEAKIDVAGSALCKKCTCDTEYSVLDCSSTAMTAWLTDDEWTTLQNGDVIFETFKLEHNNLTTIPVLPTYPLRKLYLGFNAIESIAQGAFKNLTQLTTLDLSHNKLTTKAMDPDVFKGDYSASDYLPLENMRELYLSYNDLHTLHSDLFEHLPNLEVLSLSNNVFHAIDNPAETALSGLHSLKTLDLSYMELKSLPDFLLIGPRELETLMLSGNLLTTIPKALESASNLNMLVLDENLLTGIGDENIFPDLTNLRELYMSYMPELRTIGKNAFSNLQNLTKLIASNNPKLDFIHEKAFAKDTQNPAFFDYPPLEELYLYSNNLTTLDRGLVERWDKVKFIDLRYNPWTCDCTNTWLIRTLMEQINSTMPIYAENVKCSRPAAWSGVPLTDLNLQHKILICENKSSTGRDGLILIGLLVGILIGIPITIGGLILYRRGCYGIFMRRSPSSVGFGYNRANFDEDLHI